MPEEILEGVQDMMRARRPDWHRLALAVLAEDPSAWGRWRKQLRRARRHGRKSDAARLFSVDLPGGLQIALLVSRSKDCFERLDAVAAEMPGALVIAERQGSPRRLRAISTPPAGLAEGSAPV